MAKWKCPCCGFEFDAKEPSASIPARMVWCPKCGEAAEREGVGGEVKKRLADKLRELKRAIDSLGWYQCEECGKYLLRELDEVHGYLTKDREVVVCYACLEKCERAMVEEGLM